MEVDWWQLQTSIITEVKKYPCPLRLEPHQPMECASTGTLLGGRRCSRQPTRFSKYAKFTRPTGTASQEEEPDRVDYNESTSTDVMTHVFDAAVEDVSAEGRWGSPVDFEIDVSPGPSDAADHSMDEGEAAAPSSSAPDFPSNQLAAGRPRRKRLTLRSHGPTGLDLETEVYGDAALTASGVAPGERGRGAGRRPRRYRETTAGRHRRRQWIQSGASGDGEDDLRTGYDCCDAGCRPPRGRPHPTRNTRRRRLLGRLKSTTRNATATTPSKNAERRLSLWRCAGLSRPSSAR
ncbi:uncharacterized protein LOC119400424 isoform X2 [Rhipicephalus sanguineus]|uniref:uncharacterized protein LOC119400424 isoform X2 n=1 Tax=Rhipicephalus sanguineus TaxID=34632 RepID=UPI0018962006|nr:uncharacterized protein LOC119400424 isoform X2 [Rhipicephalus sanguineus]